MTVKEMLDEMSYKQFPQYKDLSKEEQSFFDRIFPYLLVNGEIKDSDDALAAALGIPKSTIEKRLRALDNAKLIVRSHKRQNKGTVENPVWRITDRTIILNRTLFPFFNLIDKNYGIEKNLYSIYTYLKQLSKQLGPILNLDVEDFETIKNNKIGGIKNDALL